MEGRGLYISPLSLFLVQICEMKTWVFEKVEADKPMYAACEVAVF